MPNILQSFCYIYLGGARHLLDIVCGEHWKLVFVWERNNETKAFYDKWCSRTWKGIEDKDDDTDEKEEKD